MSRVMDTPIPDGVLSVVMPVYNEERTIVEIVNMVLKRPEVGEMVIVDDFPAECINEQEYFNCFMFHLVSSW